MDRQNTGSHLLVVQRVARGWRVQRISNKIKNEGHIAHDALGATTDSVTIEDLSLSCQIHCVATG